MCSLWFPICCPSLPPSGPPVLLAHDGPRSRVRDPSRQARQPQRGLQRQEEHLRRRRRREAPPHTIREGGQRAGVSIPGLQAGLLKGKGIQQGRRWERTCCCTKPSFQITTLYEPFPIYPAKCEYSNGFSIFPRLFMGKLCFFAPHLIISLAGSLKLVKKIAAIYT